MCYTFPNKTAILRRIIATSEDFQAHLLYFLFLVVLEPKGELLHGLGLLLQLLLLCCHRFPQLFDLEVVPPCLALQQLFVVGLVRIVHIHALTRALVDITFSSQPPCTLRQSSVWHQIAVFDSSFGLSQLSRYGGGGGGEHKL